MIARPGHIEGHGATMTHLIQQLARTRAVQREVLERTDLRGRYDFTLTYTPVPAPGERANAVVESGSSLFTALQEQLGLRLRSQRGSIPVVVIEQVTRPTPN